MKRIYVLLAVMGVALVAASASSATNGPPEKITICHVAGLASDPANYITLNLPPQAVYGNGGHFNEDGTTQAGHEQDSFGECNPPPPPFDQCPNIPGDQPEGYDCNPVPPPHDECENIPGDQPEGYVCNPEPPVEPPVRCEPPNPDGTYGGKDGKPGNDECIADPVPPTNTPPTEGSTPPVVVPPTPVTPTTPSPTKPVVKPEKKEKKKAEKEKTPKPEAPPVEEAKPAAVAGAKETLPYTGLSTWLGMLAGTLMIGGGILMRRFAA